MSRESHCTFENILRSIALSAITLRASSCARPRQGSSLRSAPLRGPAGLDDACAQLEGSTYVMAEEARRIFHIDPSSMQTYGEDLVGAITHPLRSRIRRGALQPSLSELRCSSFHNQVRSLGRELARPPRLTLGHAYCCRRHACIRAYRHQRAGITSARWSALHHSTNIRLEFTGVPMEFIERADDRPEPIRSRGVGNCSATKRNR